MNQQRDYILKSLALIMAGAFFYWGYRFFQILDTGDDLIAEKIFFFILLTLHLVLMQRPFAPRLTRRRFLIMAAMTALALVGAFAAKLSIISSTFVLFCFIGIGALRPQSSMVPVLVSSTAFLVLVIPHWMLLPIPSYSLQELTASMSYSLLKMIYPLTVREGFVLLVQDIPITVATSCDGSSSLRLLLMFAIYGTIGRFKLSVLTARIIAAIVLALCLNWLRITVIGVLAVHGQDEFAFRSGHALIGHITLILGLVPLFWFSNLPEMWNQCMDECTRTAWNFIGLFNSRRVKAPSQRDKMKNFP
jgi:exosortase/archaeosortase family protein